VSNPDSRVVGRYVLCGEIGAGGMATVHVGRIVGAAGFSRRVAIKRLHAHVASDPSFLAMFVDEARLASRIHHPNVVATLDVVSRDGELFVVMEYIEGVSLSELLREAARRGARMPLPVALAIGVGVLDGLHAAHEAQGDGGEKLGLVHRDVSPQNVLVGVDGVPRLIDFGVAKATGRLQTTREGQLKGKIAYMAREQLDRTEIDRRADVYAASVVLWEMLAGRRLFVADTEAQIVTLVLGGAHEPPSAHAPDVEPELDRIVMRGLALDASERFATAHEMALAIREVATPATAVEVGEWVRVMAEDALEARSARVTELLRGTLPGVAVPTAAAEAPRAPRERRRRPAAIVAFACLLLAGTGAAIALQQARGVSPRKAPAAEASVGASPAHAAAASAAASSPLPTSLAPATSQKPRTGSAHRLSSGAPSCNPPYTVDAQGVHQFKRECVVGR
jgi:hypothetical protein